VRRMLQRLFARCSPTAWSMSLPCLWPQPVQAALHCKVSSRVDCTRKALLANMWSTQQQDALHTAWEMACTSPTHPEQGRLNTTSPSLSLPCQPHRPAQSSLHSMAMPLMSVYTQSRNSVLPKESLVYTVQRPAIKFSLRRCRFLQ